MTAAEIEAQDQTYFKPGASLDGAWRSRAASTPPSGSPIRAAMVEPQPLRRRPQDRGHRLFRRGCGSAPQAAGPGGRRLPLSVEERRHAHGRRRATTISAGVAHGSQAYAFDFTMPTAPRSARPAPAAVECCRRFDQEIQSHPADNGGQHAVSGRACRTGATRCASATRGPSPAWYFHIQTNGVIVKAGDKVQRGQPIATSDNTGRTGGPPFAFPGPGRFGQLGQSVPITSTTATCRPAASR